MAWSKSHPLLALLLAIVFAIVGASSAGGLPADAASPTGHKQIKVKVKSGKLVVTWGKTTGVKKYVVRTSSMPDMSQDVKKYSTKKTKITVKPTSTAGKTSGNYTYVRVYAYKKNGKVGVSPYVKVRLTPTSPSSSAARVTVGTYNVRSWEKEDSAHTWASRKAAVAANITSANPELLAIQEAGGVTGTWDNLTWQFEDLVKALPSKYKLVSAAEYGDVGKEGSRIIYDSTKFSVVSSGVITLPRLSNSTTDRKLTRYVPWAQFQNKSTGKRVYLFSVHLDNRTSTKSKTYYNLRNTQWDAVSAKAKALAKSGNQVVVAGDFNSNLYSYPNNGVHRKAISQGFYDTYATKKNINEFRVTYNGWKKSKSSGSRVDYILTYGSKKGAYWYKNVLTTSGTIPSDHNLQLASLPY